MGAFPHIRYAAKSDIGRTRTSNEDSFGAFPESGIFCVADGMGGWDDGEVASAATVEAIERFTKECPPDDATDCSTAAVVDGVCSAVNSASQWLADRTLAKGLKGCGSTFAGICLDTLRPDSAVALHAGDSRVYRIRGQRIKQITVDHSAAELIGAKDDSDLNPMFRGVILRAVGVLPTVELERTAFALKTGDRVLICSDGLYRMVSDKKIALIAGTCNELDVAVEELVAEANAAGGIDNITVVLIEVGEFPVSSAVSSLRGRMCTAFKSMARRTFPIGVIIATFAACLTVACLCMRGGDAQSDSAKAIAQPDGDGVLPPSVAGDGMPALPFPRGVEINSDERAEHEDAAAKKQAEEREALRARQDQVVGEFSKLVNDGDAARFYAKIRRLVSAAIPKNLHREFARTVKPDLSREEKLASVVQVVKDVQMVCQTVDEYAELTLVNARARLSDPSASVPDKVFCEKVSAGVSDFRRVVGDFTEADASDLDVQMKCVLVIRSLPKWFDF